MTPAERLLAAADLLEKRVGCIGDCSGCKADAQLARVLRSALIIERSDRMAERRPNRVLKGLFHLADLLLAGTS